MQLTCFHSIVLLLISLEIDSFQDIFFKPYSNYFRFQISLHSEHFKQASAIKIMEKLL